MWNWKNILVLVTKASPTSKIQMATSSPKTVATKTPTSGILVLRKPPLQTDLLKGVLAIINIGITQKLVFNAHRPLISELFGTNNYFPFKEVERNLRNR